MLQEKMITGYVQFPVSLGKINFRRYVNCGALSPHTAAGCLIKQAFHRFTNKSDCLNTICSINPDS